MMDKKEAVPPLEQDRKEVSGTLDITSNMIPNAHASGDGSIKRSDEAIEGSESEEQKKDPLSY